MRVAYLLLFGFLFHDQLMGQVSVAEFIKSSMMAPEVKMFTSQLSFLQDKPYRLSPLQKLEFRTQNRELLSYQQEYGIRFTPANPWEVRNNNRYFQHYQTALSLEKNLVLKDVLLGRYALIISYLYSIDLKSLAEANKKLIENQLLVLERQSSSSLFDPEEYVKLKIELLDKSVSWEEIDLDIFNQRTQINQAYPTAFQMELTWSSSSLISVERIKEVMDSLRLLNVTSSHTAYQQQKMNLAESEYNLEKANVNVGFLQTEYDHRRVAQNRTPINISLGITIPLTNPNKGDMTKSKLDLIEAEHDLESAQEDTHVSREMASGQLESLITRYHDLELKVAELKNGTLSSDLSRMKNGDPLALIRFDESLNKLKVLQAKLRRNILNCYVNFLSVYDQLQQLPLIIFLTVRLDVIR